MRNSPLLRFRLVTHRDAQTRLPLTDEELTETSKTLSGHAGGIQSSSTRFSGRTPLDVQRKPLENEIQLLAVRTPRGDRPGTPRMSALARQNEARFRKTSQVLHRAISSHSEFAHHVGRARLGPTV